MNTNEINGYRWNSAALTCAHDYLLPTLMNEMARLKEGSIAGGRVFELGCGNGSVANVLVQQGWDVTGVDPSSEGIAQANAKWPQLKLFAGSAYDDLAARFGCFPVVTSLEVVEHVYFPRHYAATLFSLLEPGGTAIVSTPYHGYWKNLAMALTGKMDAHFTALWDHGHIKFWSVKTLGELLREAGFVDIRFERVGRVPVLAKAIIAIARKP
ncbi:bifunctional 2-polyprenyl-6-hydroxyphenol methylase/3-demethylubiquinol 3-O-methyltransferase UbiG [Limnohabitans sp. 2KL-3]|uniref:class I SAM-dependent methyltransferase n=1 Tax=Limnohabitans sp. 2KL-3 TaxID=1100700 RepID=UPI000AF266C5|nr:class I SAM-dependent methyltransferase [Limnohabitans sp. 2KL-3]